MAKLINKKHVKDYLLERARQHRHHEFTRVSGELLEAIDAKVRLMCQRAVKQHPSTGKTLKQIL